MKGSVRNMIYAIRGSAQAALRAVPHGAPFLSASGWRREGGGKKNPWSFGIVLFEPSENRPTQVGIQCFQLPRSDTARGFMVS